MRGCKRTASVSKTCLDRLAFAAIRFAEQGGGLESGRSKGEGELAARCPDGIET